MAAKKRKPDPMSYAIGQGTEAATTASITTAFVALATWIGMGCEGTLTFTGGGPADITHTGHSLDTSGDDEQGGPCPTCGNTPGVD